jgi:cytochrome c-type biogenesis protein CcmH
MFKVKTSRLIRGALLLVILQVALLPGIAHAVAVDPPLDDSALEARAQALFLDLRCLVCQNQSISDSNADLARDLRTIVRERVVAGDTDEEARTFLVDRYGDWVLLQPPLKFTTWLLWFGPLLLLALAAWLGLGVYRRRGRREEKVESLSAEERNQLKSLLNDADDG